MPNEARWVRHHHERYDGGGYPDGLCGDGIPLESRIILVADAFEAMTSDRPYRKAPGETFAIAELCKHAGTQFDPEVVAALCRVLDRGGIGRGAPPEPALSDA
jgi:HD-GYP domain-containing protein (c-di-GMP phosphodiesterase class II)